MTRKILTRLENASSSPMVKTATEQGITGEVIMGKLHPPYNGEEWIGQWQHTKQDG